LEGNDCRSETGVSQAMSTLNVTSLKHESASGDNITLSSNGSVGVGTSSPNKSGSNLALTVNALSGQYPAIELSTGDTGRWYINADATNVYDTAMNNTNRTFYTGGAERMRIDSAGRVTMPYQPMFSIGGSTGTSTTIAASTPYTLWSVVTNIGSHWNNSTSRFTAPVAGRYLFTCALDVRRVNNSTGAAIGGFRVNGNFINTGVDVSVGTATVSIIDQPSALTHTVIFNLSANDYVDIANRNTAITYYPGHTFASGYLLG
jgi:hypothetical protein